MSVNYFGAMGLAKGLLEARAKPSPTAVVAPRAKEAKEAADGGVAASDGSAVGSTEIGVGSGSMGQEIGFVVINSVQGKFGVPFRASYAASKHALVGFFDCLRAEEAHRGVRVTSVFPGYIRTRFGCFPKVSSRHSRNSLWCISSTMWPGACPPLRPALGRPQEAFPFPPR